MTLAPRFLVNLWFGLGVARLARRLDQPGRDVVAQRKIFTRLVASFSRCAFGRAHGLRANSSYEHFRATVRPSTYADLASLLVRIAQSEADILAPGKCALWVESAGSSTGAPKQLPVPAAMLRHYRAGLRAAWFLHAQRVGHAGIFLGRHLQAGADAIWPASDGCHHANLDGVLALCLSPWAKANLRTSVPESARLTTAAEQSQASFRALLSQDISLIAGTPAAVQELSLATLTAASQTGQRAPNLSALWPNLECMVHSGAPLGLHADPLRQTFGSSVNFHDVYLAAEGIIAAQDSLQPSGLRLLTDIGIFFEFLPLADYQATTLNSAGGKCVPLADVRTGVDYVLLLTTPAGLCRYVLGDIVRFVSTQPPRIRVVGCLHSQLNLCSEQVDESALIETLLAVCRTNGWQPVNFHVAPYTRRVAAGQTILCHEWWIELRTHTLRTPTANVLGPDLDAELARRLPTYAACRASLKLAEPCVRLVMPGVFARWSRLHQPKAANGKMAPSRSDRQIADQLAALAGFHHESAPAYTPSSPRVSA